MIFKFLNLSNVLKLASILVLLGVTAFVIEPFLHYHNQQIGFSTGVRYFESFLSYPGGVANYLGEFISQFFKFNCLCCIIEEI